MEGPAIFQDAVSSGIDDISAWMRSIRLQLNSTKTEGMWCASIVDACTRFLSCLSVLMHP